MIFKMKKKMSRNILKNVRVTEKTNQSIKNIKKYYGYSFADFVEIAVKSAQQDIYRQQQQSNPNQQ